MQVETAVVLEPSGKYGVLLFMGRIEGADRDAAPIKVREFPDAGNAKAFAEHAEEILRNARDALRTRYIQRYGAAPPPPPDAGEQTAA